MPECNNCCSSKKCDHLLNGGASALLPGKDVSGKFGKTCECCFQVTGGQFISTSKGTYSTSTDFEQQLLLPVVNPSSDFVRLALYDLNEPKGASSKTRCSRFLGKISNILSSRSGAPKVVNPETTAREGAIAEEGPDMLYKEVGELQLPVRCLLHCKQVDVEEMLVPHAEVEARVALSVRLHLLRAPKQELKEGV